MSYILFLIFKQGLKAKDETVGTTVLETESGDRNRYATDQISRCRKTRWSYRHFSF